MYHSEIEMYPDIIKWLTQHLKSNYPKAEITVIDSHSTKLSTIIESMGYQSFFPEYSTYEIYQDIVGFIKYEKKIEMIFIECKLNHLDIRAFSQLIGYSVIAKPIKAYLVSPKGMNPTLKRLLFDFNRMDVLEFLPNKFASIIKWDFNKKDIDYTSSVFGKQ